MKKKKRAWFLILPVVVSIFGILLFRMAGWVGDTEEENMAPIKTEFFGMNTYITFTAYGTDAEETLKEAKQKMLDLEAAWSVTEESSEIYQVNHSNGKTITLNEKTAEVVNYALTIAEKTEGAFEPTIYPILQAWGFTTGKNQVPDEEKLRKLLRYIGYDKINLINNQIQVPEGMEIDLGAVGKGYAGDFITELIKKKGITSALLDIGGNIQAIGARPDGTNWKIGIRNPFGEGNLGILSVADRAVVTSGNYERYFVGDDGKEYGHIMDPETGYPVENDLASITIIAKEGKQGDALSTAMYVKGLEGAIEYWEENLDFEMIAVTNDGEIYLTEEIADDFLLSNLLGNIEVNVIKR